MLGGQGGHSARAGSIVPSRGSPSSVRISIDILRSQDEMFQHEVSRLVESVPADTHPKLRAILVDIEKGYESRRPKSYASMTPEDMVGRKVEDAEFLRKLQNTRDVGMSPTEPSGLGRAGNIVKHSTFIAGTVLLLNPSTVPVAFGLLATSGAAGTVSEAKHIWELQALRRSSPDEYLRVQGSYATFVAVARALISGVSAVRCGAEVCRSLEIASSLVRAVDSITEAIPSGSRVEPPPQRLLTKYLPHLSPGQLSAVDTAFASMLVDASADLDWFTAQKIGYSMSGWYREEAGKAPGV